MSITYGYNSKQGLPALLQCVCVTMVAEWQNSSYVGREGSTANLPLCALCRLVPFAYMSHMHTLVIVHFSYHVQEGALCY